MASYLLQMGVEEELYAQAAEIYEELGIDIQTAVLMFLRQSVRDKGIPFYVSLRERRKTIADAALEAMKSMSEKAKKAGISNMTLDEINAEIEASRAERRARMAET